MVEASHATDVPREVPRVQRVQTVEPPVIPLTSIEAAMLDDLVVDRQRHHGGEAHEHREQLWRQIVAYELRHVGSVQP